MDVKLRLQRVLQMLAESESIEALSTLDREVILSELREVYSAVRFGETVESEPKVAAVVAAPVADAMPEDEAEEDVEEKEIEVEILFEDEVEEECDEPAEDEESAPEVETAPEAEPVVASVVEEVVESSPEPAPEPTPEPAPAPEPTPAPASVVEEIAPAQSDDIEAFRPRRSSILSLYDDDVTPVLGEQFRETTSVADVIACPKGVADCAPVKSLTEAIGLADKFMLVRELFDDDAEAYAKAIEALDKQTSLEDSLIYISEHYAWRPQSDGAKLMMELLQRKFDK